jgi:16S rRNA (cytidine1402-2'-O)-methyltransferase
MTQQAGRLWVVATPIGNLDDLSPRARRTLAEADVISTGLVERLRAGAQIALISDAGTPLISDPGFRLVRAAREAGISVSPVPGACAAIAALSAAGLPSDRFVFEGFLPAKSAARRTHLQALRNETRTLIFYESSHRIVETLDDLVAVFGGERRAVVARELTKLFETVLDGPLAELASRIVADPNQQRGEFVVLVAGAVEDAAAARLDEGRRVFELLRRELPPGRAAKLAAEVSGAPRKQLYTVND